MYLTHHCGEIVSAKFSIIDRVVWNRSFCHFVLLFILVTFGIFIIISIVSFCFESYEPSRILFPMRIVYFVLEIKVASWKLRAILIL